MEGSLVLRVNGTNYPVTSENGSEGVMTGLLAWNLSAISVDLRLLVKPLGQIPCWARARKSRPENPGGLPSTFLRGAVHQRSTAGWKLG